MVATGDRIVKVLEQGDPFADGGGAVLPGFVRLELIVGQDNATPPLHDGLRRDRSIGKQTTSFNDGGADLDTRIEPGSPVERLHDHTPLVPTTRPTTPRYPYLQAPKVRKTDSGASWANFLGRFGNLYRQDRTGNHAGQDGSRAYPLNILLGAP